MKQTNWQSILIFFVLLAVTISPVLAESINGTFGMTSATTTTVVASHVGTPIINGHPENVTFFSIENVGHITAIITYEMPAATFSADAGVNGSDTAFTSAVGPGHIGFQKVFSGDGSTYLYGYAYVTFDNFNRGALTGRQSIILTYDHSKMYNLTIGHGANNAPDDPNNYFGYLSGNYDGGSNNLIFSAINPEEGNGYTQNSRQYQYANIFQANTTSTGIQGYIVKHFYDSNGVYQDSPSKAWVTNNNDNTLIAGDTSSTLNTLNFNSIATRDITLTMQDPTGVMWNQTFGGLTNFTLSANPSTINPNQSTTVSLSSSLGIFGGYNWYGLQCLPLPGCKVNGTSPYFSKIGTHWYQMVDNTKTYSIDLGTAFPSSVSLNQITNPGINYIYASLSPEASNSNLNQINLNTSVTVNPTGSYGQLTVNVKDALTGGYIYGANASTTLPGISWTNKSVTNGPVIFSYPKGQLIGYTATATGYDTPFVTYLVLDQDTTVTVSMTKPTTSATGFANLNVYVNAANNPVQSALVSLFQGPSQYTGAQGLASFNLSWNTNGSLTVSKSGYASVTKPWTCDATTCTNVFVDLIPQTTAPTALPSNIPTTSANGTYTGFWGPWYKGLHTMGADNSELPILMAGLITMIFLIIGAAITRDHVGAIAGALIGFLLSIAFGFIGLVYIIVLIVAGIFIVLFLR